MNIASKGPRNYQELLDADTRTVPEIARGRGTQDAGPREIPTSWYLDPDIHAQEAERIWKKTWLMACRDDDLANVGDTWVYRLADISILLVRSSADKIQAFYNSCLHRGRTLRECPGNVSMIQCPFHGFTWSLNGRLKMVPSRPQFPQVNPEDFRLPEVKVGHWGGFTFINLDPGAEPLEKFLGSLPQHFERWPLDQRVKVAHVEKAFNCNWKLAQDAFLEAFHVNTTHPQMMMYLGEHVHQYDVFDKFARGILGTLVPSQLAIVEKTPQKIFNGMMGIWADDETDVRIPDDAALRPTVAALWRDRARASLGEAVEQFSDSELLDTTWYSVFPNFIPFMGFSPPIVYTFRPDGNNHERSIMEVMILVPPPPDGSKPAPAKLRVLGDDENWLAAPELGGVGVILNQDTGTLDHLTLGVKNNRRGKLVLASNHELMVRHFYARWQDAMGITA